MALIPLDQSQVKVNYPKWSTRRGWTSNAHFQSWWWPNKDVGGLWLEQLADLCHQKVPHVVHEVDSKVAAPGFSGFAQKNLGNSSPLASYITSTALFMQLGGYEV